MILKKPLILAVLVGTSVSVAADDLFEVKVGKPIDAALLESCSTDVVLWIP